MPVLTVGADPEATPATAAAVASSVSPIDEIVREGARRMLAAASEAEVAAYIDAHTLDEDGHRLVVRKRSRGAASGGDVGGCGAESCTNRCHCCRDIIRTSSTAPRRPPRQSRGGDAEGMALGYRLAEKLHEGRVDARVRDAARREQELQAAPPKNLRKWMCQSLERPADQSIVTVRRGPPPRGA